MNLMLAFALGFLLLAMAALFIALISRRRERRLLEDRLQLMAMAIRTQQATEPAQAAGASQLAAERLRRIVALGLAHTWGTHASATIVLLLAACAAATMWLLMKLLMQQPFWIAALAAGGAFVLLPRFLFSREQRKAENKFTNFFPDAVDMGVRMLRAGLPISSAIRAIGNEAAAPVDGVFKGIADQVEIGIPFEEALATTAIRIGLPDFRFFSVAVTLQRATGGNLASTLEILSDIMRKRRALRLKAQATTAEVRVSAYILGSMPFLVMGILLLIQPGYLAPLVTDPRGKIILGVAAAMLTMGFVMMRHMMRSAIKT